MVRIRHRGPCAEIVARQLPATATVRILPPKGSAEVVGIPIVSGRNGYAPGGIWLHFAVGDGGNDSTLATESDALTALLPASTERPTASVTEEIALCERRSDRDWRHRTAPELHCGPRRLAYPDASTCLKYWIALVRENRYLRAESAWIASFAAICGSSFLSFPVRPNCGLCLCDIGKLRTAHRWRRFLALGNVTARLGAEAVASHLHRC